MSRSSEFDPTRKSSTPRWESPNPVASTREKQHTPSSHSWSGPAFIMPRVGDILEHCKLVAQLGYGSSGQVFLAEETALADRPIVLKVTVLSHEEHLNLARLQHTNIMPLFWASSLGHMGLRVIAMPYLAKTTLAALLQRMESLEQSTWSGQQIFHQLQEDQVDLPVQIALNDHQAQMLRQLTWVQFVAQMGRTLAEALAYAHRRGILHLDIKPSNIVVTPDGQPILLDLDVARKPIAAGTLFVPWLGGTPTFMSPEQSAAMDALTREKPIPKAVDERSDLYSLGMVLYVALGGICDERQRADPRTLPGINSEVSPGLAAIIGHCLAENPADRYPDCNALAADLDRHLHDLPLHGVRNRLPERWQKWRRRRPLGLPLGLLSAACLIAGLWAGWSDYQVHEERRAQAETALSDGQELQRRGQFEAATRRFLAGQELAQQTRGAGQLEEHLARGLHNVRRQQAAAELNQTVHLMRFYALQDRAPRRLQYVFEAAARKLWNNRTLLLDRSAGSLEPAMEEKIAGQLQELVALWADVQIRLAPAAHLPRVRADVRAMINQAEQEFGPSCAIKLAQQQHGPAAAGGPLEPRVAWEYSLLARAALVKGENAEAKRLLERALDLTPLDFAANFHAGVLALRQHEHDKALQAFSYCLGMEPQAECFLMRGEAYAASGATDEALRDYNLAIVKNAECALVYEQRGRLLRTLGRAADAQRDLDRANQLRD